MELYHFYYISDIVESNTGSQLDRKESRSTTLVQLQCWIFGSESLKWEVENRITWSIFIYSSISMTHVSRYQRKIVLNVIAMVTGRESVIISLFLFPTWTGYVQVLLMSLQDSKDLLTQWPRKLHFVCGMYWHNWRKIDSEALLKTDPAKQTSAIINC